MEGERGMEGADGRAIFLLVEGLESEGEGRRLRFRIGVISTRLSCKASYEPWTSNRTAAFFQENSGGPPPE